MMSHVKLTMLLCDHAAVADGKLYINGGGWAGIGPDPAPSAIALLIEVPWDRADSVIDFKLTLRHEDGQLVSQLGPAGPQGIEVGGQIEVGRPLDIPEGSPLPVPLAINLAPFQLEPGNGYYWEAEVSGEVREDWRLSFRVWAPPAPGPDLSDPTSLPSF